MTPKLIKLKCEACQNTGIALVIAPETVLELLAEIERWQQVGKMIMADNERFFHNTGRDGLSYETRDSLSELLR